MRSLVASSGYSHYRTWNVLNVVIFLATFANRISTIDYTHANSTLKTVSENRLYNIVFLLFILITHIRSRLCVCVTLFKHVRSTSMFQYWCCRRGRGPYVIFAERYFSWPYHVLGYVVRAAGGGDEARCCGGT